MAAGPSTILTPPTRHCAPNTAEPSLVIRLTTCDGGSEGGMIGAGGGIGAGCANRSDEIVTANANDEAARPVLRMYSSPVVGRLVSNRINASSGTSRWQLGKMLHQLGEQAEVATPTFLLQCLVSCWALRRHSKT